MWVIDNQTGQEVKPGDSLVSFRGERATLVRAVRAQQPGKSGKVLVRWVDRPVVSGMANLEYYDKVFNVSVVRLDVMDHRRPELGKSASISNRDVTT